MYLKRRKLAWVIFGVMTLGFILLLFNAVYYEMNGNPAIAKMGIAQPLGSMEGKEVRFGPAASAYWAVTTTVTSNGSVNSMHDSFTPLAGMSALLGMMINAFYGGVGVGFLNFYIFIIIAVFISGLNGRPNTGVFRQEDRSKGNEDRFHYCIAASIAYSCRHCIVILFICSQS